MAEQSNDGKNNPQQAPGPVSWTVDKVLGAILGALVSGAAGGWLGATVSSNLAIDDITASMNEVMPKMMAIERAQMYIQDALDDADISKLRSDIRDIERDVGHAMQELSVLLAYHREHSVGLDRLSDVAKERFSSVDKKLETMATKASIDKLKGAITPIKEIQVEMKTSLKELNSEMSAMRKILDESYRRSLSKNLAHNIKRGKSLLALDDAAPSWGVSCETTANSASSIVVADNASPQTDRCGAARDWMKMASYFVRSLEIPTEKGVLRDTSVVKEEIQRAMREFEQAASKDSKARIGGMRGSIESALVILRTVENLASTGRQY